jgi:serine/threonine protein kinase
MEKNMETEKKIKTEITESELIGQGSYGCVFKPNINDKGETESNSEYISKLQLSGDTLENEINIGKKIQSITDYEEHFSPILEKYPIELKQIEKEQPELSDCEVTNDLKDDTTIFLDKIKYVGKNSLQNYLSIMKKGEPKKFLELFLETNIILLESLEKLNKIGIIHNDLKEDNIICRNDDGRPILIDFGLSMDNDFMFLPNNNSILNIFTQNTNTEKTAKEINTPEKSSQLNNYFFRYEPSYEIWCIDIVIINYILNVLKKEEKSSPIKINVIIEDYIKKNKIFEKKEEQQESLFNEEEKNKFRDDLKKELEIYNSETSDKLLETLLTYQKTWDNYALSIIYLRLLKIHEEDIRKQIANKYDEYTNILKSIILSKPSERKLPEETRENILKVLQKTKRII